ncbi:SH3 domain-containing protein [Oscillospiraceae bacterium HV4-5-C5C]|nr:SH3 domain-containing protein [Oscillospiraceae bacterium HV4-5-C5C]
MTDPEAVSRRQRRRYVREANQRYRKNRRRRRLERLRFWRRGGEADTAHRVLPSWLRPSASAEEKIEPHQIPGWFFPMLSLAVILLLLFVVLPPVLEKVVPALLPQEAAETVAPDEQTAYPEGTMVVLEPVADVYEQADIKADRLTQVLYNATVQALDQSGVTTGFTLVRLADGREGYIKTAALTTSLVSVSDPSLKTRLVVTDLYKKILSQAGNGNELAEVKMGTVLYSSYHTATAYRVVLPGGGDGWITSNGLLSLDREESITESSAEQFTDSLLAFTNATYLPGGVSYQGASLEGILPIAAFVNGLSIPTTIQEQYDSLPAVDNVLNANGSLNYYQLQNGDILYLKASNSDSTTESTAIEPAVIEDETTTDSQAGTAVDQTLESGPDAVAVWVDYGIVLYESKSGFTLEETDADTLLESWTLMGVRRPFEN